MWPALPGRHRPSQYAASVAATKDCILATSPAYSISGTDEGAKTVQSFTVPNNVHKLRFEMVGGAGGTNNRMLQAGSGAKVTGIIPVTPGSTVQIIAAAGGIGDGSLNPTAGGEGYGNGGSVPAYTIPANIIAQVDAKYPNPANSKSQVYAASGGGSSALLIDGTVVAVAGVGGGAGMTSSGVSYADPWYSNLNGQIDAGVASLGSDASPQFSVAGSASAAAGSVGTPGYEIYNAERSKVLTYNSGAGGVASVGGAGYGGGGSGAAQSVSSIVLTQKWLNSPTGVRQGLGYTMQGGTGGAGGSYLAPSVTDGAIASAENAPQWMRERGNGSVKVTFCEAAA